MRLYTYVVARDYGFAPNPFGGWCTLATCKPEIRRTAQVGDLIAGTGSAARKTQGHLVYAMYVTETMTFDQYWQDPRFNRKRPNLRGSLKQAFGDNIYHHAPDGSFDQEDSHHALKDGQPNPLNVDADTGVDRVLISDRFVYFGDTAPLIPKRVRERGDEALCPGRGHRCRYSDAYRDAFVRWLDGLAEHGVQGRPASWSPISR